MRYIRLSLRMVLLVLFLTAPAIAQETNPPPTPQQAVDIGRGVLTNSEIIISFGVLAFGLIMTGAGIFLLKATATPSAEVIRLIALLLIVSGVLFLVAAGYSAQDISPALGLLGTVAGYLLGKSERTPAETPAKKIPPEEEPKDGQ